MLCATFVPCYCYYYCYCYCYCYLLLFAGIPATPAMRSNIKQNKIKSNKYRLYSGIMDHGQALMKEQYPHIRGFYSIASMDRLPCTQPPYDQHFVQILLFKAFKGNHWIVISDVFSPKGTLDVYDSSNASRIPISEKLEAHEKLEVHEKLEAQVASFFHQSITKTTMSWPEIQQQRGNYDCGLFALAFATSLCAGIDPRTLHLDQDHMRAHLIKCITDKIMQPFSAESR